MNGASIRGKNCERDNLKSGLRNLGSLLSLCKSGGEAKNKSVVARLTTTPPPAMTTGTAADDDVVGGVEDGGVWERA